MISKVGSVGVHDLKLFRYTQRQQACKFGARSSPGTQTLRAMLDVGDLFKGANPPPETVLQAVETAGRRVTGADIASEVGMSLTDAQEALSTLAMLTGGALEVSDDGEIVYIFDPSFRNTLRARYCPPQFSANF